MCSEYLEAWLYQFDPLPLECDGLSRVISALLTKSGVDHKLVLGFLHGAAIEGEATPRRILHWWIEIGEQVVDFRARMWMGDRAPHGLFHPTALTEFRYEAIGPETRACPSIQILSVMAGIDLAALPTLSPQ